MIKWLEVGIKGVGARVTTEGGDTRAEENRRVLRGARTQRWLLLAGGCVFLLAVALAYPPETIVRKVAYALAAAATLAFALKRWGWSDAKYPLMFVPVAASTVFSLCVAIAANAGPPSNSLLYALLLASLGPFLSLLAPARRGAIAALAAMSLIGMGGALLAGARSPIFETPPALAFLLGAVVLSISIAHVIETARREAIILRSELARRATSDEITGVSNRAHVSLLAQNEFSRARRYAESYSCLMIEIEEYDRLLQTQGDAAVTAIVQVFTGYCVVVMRHCDSFGRLAPNRFLALLPETSSPGAQTLASRMCRDLAALGVAFGGGQLHFNVSIGCAEMHAVDRWAGDMLRRAEQGLSDALERGGNCAVFAAVPIHQPMIDQPADEEPTAAGDTPP